MKTSLTGIKPTHRPHLGNYLGAIRPALSLVEHYRTLYFIADYHALTSVRKADALRGYIRDVATLVAEVPYTETLESCENNKKDIPYGQVKLPGK